MNIAEHIHVVINLMLWDWTMSNKIVLKLINQFENEIVQYSRVVINETL